MLQKIGSDGRIRTTLKPGCYRNGTYTSSQEPNLQNVPGIAARSLDAKSAALLLQARAVFLSGRTIRGWNPRVLARIGGDEALIAAFNDGDDIHTRTAAEVFGVPKDEVTREMRSAAKAVNFGIVYGIGAYRPFPTIGYSARRKLRNTLKSTLTAPRECGTI